jgi:hypothetical protein
VVKVAMLQKKKLVLKKVDPQEIKAGSFQILWANSIINSNQKGKLCAK